MSDEREDIERKRSVTNETFFGGWEFRILAFKPQDFGIAVVILILGIRDITLYFKPSVQNYNFLNIYSPQIK